jgi:hypothetical protein
VKKVRYALAAAGLAPVAGMMVPTAALASPGTKTVAGHALTPNAGCTGTEYTGKFTGGHATGWYWYTPAGRVDCIGTVGGFLPKSRESYYGSPQLRVRVYNGSGVKEFSALRGSAGFSAKGFTNSVGVHKDIGQPANVCVAWLSGTGGLQAGPVCHAV